MPKQLKMTFTCSVCGKTHQEFPAIAYEAPYYYYNLSEQERIEMAVLTQDFCIIQHSDQTDRFIRVVLNQKIIGSEETLQYGVWVSLSEQSYNDYAAHFKSPDYIASYFGYLSNQLPGYESALSIKTTVETTINNNRPEIFPHDDQMDDPFVRDYYEGITREEAERRMHAAYGIEIK